MDDNVRLQRAATFDQVADLYDSARREPPADVFEDLLALSLIDPPTAHVLEIGCGTGQATLPLARCGCRVSAVEMGSNLARIARRKLEAFPKVTVINERFEDWNPNGATFDVVLAITSWHWLDPRLRYAKAAAVLPAGGTLALTTGGHVFPPDADPCFAEIQVCYQAIGEARAQWPPAPPETLPDSADEISRSGLFEDVQTSRRISVRSFTADEYVALMRTASDHRLMEEAKREWLFAQMRRLIDARPEGRIRRHELTIIHVARRRRAR